MGVSMFDPVLLRSFVALAEAGSFTRAAEQLQLSQPTVSQHIRRLEAAAQRVFVLRDSRSVKLTDNGEAMLRFARDILAAHDGASAYFSGPAMKGRIRFGAADDLALTELPPILREFRRIHSQVNLILSVGQSGPLARSLRAGQLDLAYVKQEADQPDGRLVRRDRQVWVAHPSLRISPEEPVPLVSYPVHSLSRVSAVRALDSIGRSWRITCNVQDMNGAVAAVRAGIGLGVLPRGMIPGDLAVADPAFQLPALDEVDFVLLANPRTTGGPADALTDAILRRAGTDPAAPRIAAEGSGIRPTSRTVR
jgi:DNA-binding transcriptional LysR family regulator